MESETLATLDHEQRFSPTSFEQKLYRGTKAIQEAKIRILPDRGCLLQRAQSTDVSRFVYNILYWINTLPFQKER